MSANYARIVRRSAVVMAAVGAVMLVLGAGVAGGKGLLGAAIGLAIVAVFFAISVVAVGRAARVSPQAMMLTAIITYGVKILALIILAGQLQGSAAFNGRIFGLTAIVCVLAYSAAQMIWSIRLKMPYIEPGRER